MTSIQRPIAESPRSVNKKLRSVKNALEPTLFTNIGSIMTMGGAQRKNGREPAIQDFEFIVDAAILVRDGKIKWLGQQAEIPQSEITPDLKIIDLEKKNVFPGFVECHTHLVYAGDRHDELEQRIRGATYQEIAEQGGGILKTVRATRVATEEHLVSLAQERESTFARQGVTTIEIKSGYGLNRETELKILRAARQLQRCRIVTTFLGPHAIPKEYVGKADLFLDDVVLPLLTSVRGENLATRADIFVEKGYFNLEHGRRYLKRAQELGFDLCVHAEQMSRFGATELALEFNAHSAEHVVEINAHDIHRLAKSDTVAVLLPAADFYLNMSYPPARALLDAGAQVALATDFNPGSSPTQDLSLVGVLARLQMKMTLPEVWAAYTVSAARALRLDSHIGSLQVGYDADFFTSHADWSQFFCSVGVHPVDRVWRQGVMIEPH